MSLLHFLKVLVIISANNMFSKKEIIAIVFLLVLAVLFWYSKNEMPQLTQEGWAIYRNIKNGYSIEYPAEYLTPRTEEGEDNVLFCSPGDPCVIGVRVSKTILANLDDWLSQNPNQRVEKKLWRSGYEGLIAHYFGSEGDVEGEKIMVFIKDGELYSIGTFYARYPDRILNSFKFE